MVESLKLPLIVEQTKMHAVSVYSVAVIAKPTFGVNHMLASLAKASHDGFVDC